MTTVALHYDLHLAEHYSWLFGGLPERVAENRAYFESIGLRGARALDVGAGSGFQSIPLARLGFSVVAVDLSEKLLAELRASAGDLPIETMRDDILACIGAMRRESFDACVCMGDTLTHLQSFGDVQRLLREAHRVLAPGARFVIAIRDYSGELHGEDRFVPVRADESTVFSCFLEYEGDHVRVYDIIQARSERGWEMRVSSYKKLRIAPDWLEKRLRESGFEVLSRSVVSGLVTIDARRA
ncbi:MAG TPA: class I SAM-dependent methyltransferase [Polyangiaceae bacterium]